MPVPFDPNYKLGNINWGFMGKHIRAPGYTAFDYDKAFNKYRNALGESPYAPLLKKYSGWAQNPLAPWKGIGQGTSGAFWDTYVAHPDDPEVKDYMAHVLSGQRRSLMDYVRQASKVGIPSRGYGVAGAAPLNAALYKQAMDRLAAGYESRFKEAMDYNKYVQGQLYEQQRDYARDYSNTALQLLGYLNNLAGGQASWQQSLGNAMRQDYQRDIDFWRELPIREAQWEHQMKQMALQDRQARDEYNRRQLAHRNVSNFLHSLHGGLFDKWKAVPTARWYATQIGTPLPYAQTLGAPLR
jgi:hypothetical protein